MYSAEKCFNIRKKFGDWDDSFDEPDVKNFHSYGDFQLVGHGKVTNAKCGKFSSFYGCARIELHNRITLDGKNFKGKVYTRKIFHSCDKPSCPVCYKYGWAVRGARKIEVRLAEASKRFGLVEHIVVSVPPKDYGLTFDALRKKVGKVLAVRGVVGGNIIFHGLRYNLRKSWYWSPHFHVLGFVLGGYSRCRNCKRKWNCLVGCGGFDDRSYQNFLKDGYYVKVLGKRKTVFGTAWYQLNHASVKKNVKRFHVATWFGVCSYRKLKVTAEKRKDLCPICRHDLINIRYFGSKSIACVPERDSFEDYVEDGRIVWVERVGKKYGSDSLNVERVLMGDLHG